MQTHGGAAIKFVNMKQSVLLTVVGSLTIIPLVSVPATEPPPPKIDALVVSGDQKNLRMTPSPGADAYYFYSATNANAPFALDTNFVLSPYITGYSTNYITNGTVVITNLAYEWRTTNFSSDSGFFRLTATSIPSNTTLGVTVMNRLAYGPTPDDLPIVLANPQAYIDQQLDMGGFPPEPMDDYVIETTNAIASDPTTNWTYVSIRGTLNTTNLYLFMTAPGDVFVDDIQLIEGTNGVPNPNLLSNGDFESTLTPPWVLSGGAIGSYVTNGVSHSGSGCLHVAATTAGNTAGNNLRLPFVTSLTNGTPVTLSYWYLPGPTSSKLKLQVGPGSQLVSSAGGIPSTPTWVYATATGKATSTSAIYIYLSGAGTAYVDDMVLVAGTNAGVGVNLLQNGDFEAPLSGTWASTTDFTNSTISTTVARSGAGSLQLVATAAGSGANDSVIQNVTPALVNGATYTLSYWCQQPTPPAVTLTIRLSGANLSSTPENDTGGIYHRLGNTSAQIADYRAWFCSHAVSSQAQLFEILSQFLENHFVTQYSKSRDFLQGKGYSGTVAGVLATDWEWREMKRWREALKNPNCTFYDLLKISAESPAMIVYLDTVNSKGNNNNVANENYARELQELFCFGVDNGYDQNDIVNISRAWTGWSVELVDPENANNPFAPASVTYYPDTNSASKANTIGVWAFKYNAGNHGTNRSAIFPGKSVPARFGPPWAGRTYQLTLPVRPTGDTNSIQDGYDVIAHLADQPFTEEFISVKLCRLFVHDGFPNPTTRTDLPVDYAFYDYTDPNHSAEAELVHQCMLAWENSTPKGNLRAVLSTIFNSDLFRSHTGQAQKVKTPLEFAISSVRALRSVNPDGSTTANTDGYSFASPLSRMGGMNLFDRDAPDGYAEDASPWISAGTLVERIRFVQSLCIAFGSTGHANSSSDAGNNVSDPVALLKQKLPASSWDKDGDVADYFLSLLFPAEGAANLALYRSAAINFLNTSDTGTTTSTFSTLGNTSATYDTRVRGMVALLMASARYQEQ
jgi:uncharacterized protein (DUF1800 family)